MLRVCEQQQQSLPAVASLLWSCGLSLAGPCSRVQELPVCSTFLSWGVPAAGSPTVCGCATVGGSVRQGKYLCAGQ